MRTLAIIFAVSVLLTVTAPAVQAQTLLQATEYQVTTDSLGHSTPIIAQDSIGYYVVYTEYPVVNGVAGNAAIYYQRITNAGQPSGSPVVVADSAMNQYLNDAYGDYIVYTVSPGVGQVGDIALYQISTGMSNNLTDTGDSLSPRIYGSYVIWLEELAKGTQIIMYDITTGYPVQAGVLAGPTPSINDAAIGSRFIGWSQMVNNQLQIAGYDMQQNVSEVVSAQSQFNEENVATYGPWITFEVSSVSDTGGIAVEAINMATATTITVASNGTDNQRPNISGDLLSYESNSLGYYQIFIYRLAEGDTYQVTSSSYNERLNNIDGNLVTYVDNRTGNDEVYLSSINFVSRSTPVTASVSPMNFGNVNIGRSSAKSELLYINTGLTLSSVQASGDYSVLSNSCSLNAPLSAGTICTLQVQFKPTKPGQRWFPLVATDSNSNNYNFGLQGTGVGSALSFTPGIMTTVAGNGSAGYIGDGYAATQAKLSYSYGVALDSAGNFFIADTNNSVVRKVDTNGIITTVAGTGTAGYSGDGFAAISAQISIPYGVTVDSAGNLYIADTYNHRIRVVSSLGVITTVAGTGTAGYSGDNGPAVAAELNFPGKIAVDGAGNFYFSDINNNVIRKVNINGIITTVAGTGTPGYSGDKGPATSAELWFPYGVALDSVGNLYIADRSNSRIRKVATNGIITTVAGNGTWGGTGDTVGDKRGTGVSLWRSSGQCGQFLYCRLRRYPHPQGRHERHHHHRGGAWRHRLHRGQRGGHQRTDV